MNGENFPMWWQIASGVVTIIVLAAIFVRCLIWFSRFLGRWFGVIDTCHSNCQRIRKLQEDIDKLNITVACHIVNHKKKRKV